MKNMNLQNWVIIGLLGYIGYTMYQAKKKATEVVDQQTKVQQDALKMAQDAIASISV